MFITVEGPDYSGKTTQVEYIKDYYESIGKAVLVTREPGGTAVGMKIREILVNEDTKNDPLSVTTQLLLLFAARAHHVSSVVIPALKEGAVVISDRFIDSTYVYQGLMYNHKSTIDQLLRVDHLSHLRARPDYTFFYDIDYETMLARMQYRGVSNSLDEKYAKLKERPIDDFKHHFYSLNQINPGAIKIIDGTQDLQTVKQATVALCGQVTASFGKVDLPYLEQVKILLGDKWTSL